MLFLPARPNPSDSKRKWNDFIEFSPTFYSYTSTPSVGTLSDDLSLLAQCQLYIQDVACIFATICSLVKCTLHRIENNASPPPTFSTPFLFQSLKGTSANSDSSSKYSPTQDAWQSCTSTGCCFPLSKQSYACNLLKFETRCDSGCCNSCSSRNSNLTHFSWAKSENPHQWWLQTSCTFWLQASFIPWLPKFSFLQRHHFAAGVHNQVRASNWLLVWWRTQRVLGWQFWWSDFLKTWGRVGMPLLTPLHDSFSTKMPFWTPHWVQPEFYPYNL